MKCWNSAKLAANNLSSSLLSLCIQIIWFLTQMGSKFKETLFNEFQQDLLRKWLTDSKPGSSGSMNRLTTESTNPICLAQQPVVDGGISTASEIELPCSDNSHVPSS